MKMSSLFRGIGDFSRDAGNPDIRGIASDSRLLKKGDLFVAIPGTREDGSRFIPDAVRKGAAAIVAACPVAGLDVPQVVVEDPRSVLALLAARYYEDPSLDLNLFGVTGTNGKTTVTYLLESILKEAGRLPAVFGTVNYRFGSRVLPAENTTPGPVALQSNLARMRDGKTTDVIMEVSSHALSQERVKGVHFKGVAFTNLSRDHLDYHRDLDDYFSAKLRLFSEILPASRKDGKFSVVNMESPHGVKVLAYCSGRVVRVGFDPRFEVAVRSSEVTRSGFRLSLNVEGKACEIRSSLMGRFNLENILVATGLASGEGIPLGAIREGIEGVKKVPGRLEAIPNKKGISVFVDYAHTPEALERVGQVLRESCRGRLITVFGCGGDRDSGKRPRMGEAAARFSDFLVVTSDNPRTEDPEKILDDVLGGTASFDPGKIYRIVDREEGIEKGVSLARSGDTLLVAGKGHEDYQIIGTERRHFSDQEVLRELLGARKP